MIIPEDGCLPQITRKGFSAFNNVMIIKVPEKLKKPGEASFQLATLDRSKKGERWPADQYVDIVMNVPAPKETCSTEKSPGSKANNTPAAEKNKSKNKGKFCPQKFNFIKKYPRRDHREATSSDNFNRHQQPHGNKPLYNEKTFNDNRYPQTSFSSEHQLYDSLQGPHPNNRFVAQGQNNNATISREPLIKNGPYSNNCNSHSPLNYQHHLGISPSKPPFNDFRPPQHCPPPFLTNPPEMGRRGPLIQGIPNAYNGNFEDSSYNPPGMSVPNNFMLPYPKPLETELSNGIYPRDNLPPPPRNYQQDRNYEQPIWIDPNHQNYHRNPGNERNFNNSWRGRGGNNRYPKGKNRRGNNRYQKKPSQVPYSGPKKY